MFFVSFSDAWYKGEEVIRGMCDFGVSVEKASKSPGILLRKLQFRQKEIRNLSKKEFFIGLTYLEHYRLYGRY